MNENNLFDTFQIELKTITPVFIGSGKTYSKNEYIYIAEQNKILIPDIPKLFHEIIERNLVTEYQNFIETDQERDLGKWLSNNGFRLYGTESWVSHTMNVPSLDDEQIEKSNADLFPMMELEGCMKNAYGKPYIPGSSLKGAMRTVLFAEFITREKKKNPKRFDRTNRWAEELISIDMMKIDNYNEYKDKIEKLKREIKYLEQLCFNKLRKNSDNRKDLKNDYMSLVRVSDSCEIDKSNIVLAQKVDTFKDGTKNRINTLRESILSKESIKFDVTIDKSARWKVGKRDFEKAIRTFSDITKECFVSQFLGSQVNKSNIIYLGGGTGFASKTVIYALFGKDIGKEVTSRILHFNLINPKELKKKKIAPLWVQHGHAFRDSEVSPHTIKTFNIVSSNNMLTNKEMGICEFNIV